MTASCAASRASASPLYWLAAILFLIGVVAPAAAAEPVAVALDQATIIQLPDRATTVVVGNPLIADASIQPGGLTVITGKGYGATNIVVLDRHGAVLMEKIVEVKGPSDPIVVVFRGPTRQTYSCTPECSRRVTIGDTGIDLFTGEIDKDFFAKTIEQTVTRNDKATGAGAAVSGR